MIVKTAPNGFALPVPRIDANGVTAQEFAASLFEFEYCTECGRDAEDHTFVIGPFGAWFAFCDKLNEVSQ